MPPTVVVAGGGYGGASVAKALDDIADVTLIEPREAFLHNVASLRAAVRPGWEALVFLPYSELLTRGSVIRDRIVQASEHSLVLASGARISPDYTVLATGSGYPFPAKVVLDGTAAAQDKYRSAQKELARAEHALLLGAGPVGLELAGEIRAAWPGKRITIIDPVAELLGRYSAELREEIHRQLTKMDIALLLGSQLAGEPPSMPGIAQQFTVSTRSGIAVRADIWFRCYGAKPVTGYLAGELADARTPEGTVRVLPTLQVDGQANIFALGDITNLPEIKRAGPAMRHASVIAGNVSALIDGRSDLATYQPGPEGILIPLGPAGGASFLPGHGLLGAEATAQRKGADLMIGRFAEMFGLPSPRPGSAPAASG